MKFQRLHDLREDSDLSQKKLGKSCTSAREHIPTTRRAAAVFLWKCLSGLRIITIPVLISGGQNR